MKKENYIGLGLLIGTVIGFLTDDLALWMSIGIAIGAGAGYGMSPKNQKGNSKEES